MRRVGLICNGCGRTVAVYGPGWHQTEVECGECGYRMTEEETDA